MRCIVFSLITFFCIFIHTQIAFSATYHLKWDGDGRTVIDGDTFCSGACSSGDIIELPAGTTNDGLYIKDLRGSDGNPIIIQNTSGSQTVIDMNDNEPGGYGSGNGIWIQNSRYIKIDGSNGYDESDESNLSYGIRITDCRRKGIFLNMKAYETEIQYLEIDHIGNVLGIGGIGIKENSTLANSNISEGDTLSGLYIHHNYIHNIATEAMYLGATGACTSYDCCNSVDDSDKAIKWSKVWVYKNKTDDTGWEGISVGCCEDSLVYGNEVTDAGLDNYTGPGQGMGISLNRGFGGSCYGNKILRPHKQGIYFQGSAAVDIYNNVIVDTGIQKKAGEGHGIVINGSIKSAYAKVRYNTIVRAFRKGIYYAKLSTGLVQDNLIVDEDEASTFGSATATNYGVKKSTVAECGFEDADNDNYDLTATTPKTIVGAGQASGYPDTDFEGSDRIGGAVDIGAYAAGDEQQPLLPPTDLRTIN